MLKIITCFKWVIDEADIKVDTASRRLLLDRVTCKISPYDRNAVEEGMLLQEKHGAQVVAVTVAPSTGRNCIKDVLSRGPEKAFFIHDPSFTGLEPSQTSALLAKAIERSIDFDLILCGEGSSDLYAQQVGPALAERLGISCATYVNKLTVMENENRIVVERKLEEGIETVSVPLPALVTVLPDINTPRIPSLKQVLGAARKPVENITLDMLGGHNGPCLETVEIQAAIMERRRLKFGSEEADIRAVVNALLKEGVIA